MPRILLTFDIVFLFGTIKINASDLQSKHKVDEIKWDICERLNENKKQKQHELIQDEFINDDKIRNDLRGKATNW